MKIIKLFKNIGISTLTFILQIILMFFLRKVFILNIGIEYLGINELYTNILTVLSLTNLGVETAFVYFLYEPLVKNDLEMIATLVNTFRKIYRWIALVLFISGLIIIPFLHLIIGKSIFEKEQILIYYLFFLFNNILSYFAMYKVLLLQADQNIYIVKIIKIIILIIGNIFQMYILIKYKNYMLYLIIMILITILTNITLNYVTNSYYPFLKKNSTKVLNEEFKKRLIQKVKDAFLYKIATTIINSTDNILISIILGNIIVGYYSNYYVILTAIISMIGILNSSLISGIGNYLKINKENKKNEILFSRVILIYFIIATILTSSIVLCINDFIIFWLGRDFILSKSTILVISINFYFQCIAHPLWMFRESSGLFDKIRNCILLMAFLNIIFSYILGKLFGLSGIIGATVISRIFTLYWYEPRILYKEIFKESVHNYWKIWIKYFKISSMLLIILYFSLKNVEENIYFSVIKIVISTITTIIYYCFKLKKTDEMEDLKQIVKKIKKLE